METMLIRNVKNKEVKIEEYEQDQEQADIFFAIEDQEIVVANKKKELEEAILINDTNLEVIRSAYIHECDELTALRSQL